MYLLLPTQDCSLYTEPRLHVHNFKVSAKESAKVSAKVSPKVRFKMLPWFCTWTISSVCVMGIASKQSFICRSETSSIIRQGTCAAHEDNLALKLFV